MTTSLLMYISLMKKVCYLCSYAQCKYFPSQIVVQVSLSVENGGVVSEANGVMLVTVTLTGVLKRDVTVTIYTNSGTGM